MGLHGVMVLAQVVVGSEERADQGTERDDERRKEKTIDRLEISCTRERDMVPCQIAASRQLDSPNIPCLTRSLGSARRAS